MRRDDSSVPDRTGPEVPAAPEGGRAGDQADLRQLQRERQTRVAKLIVALVIVGILIAFIVANSQSVIVHFVFFTRRPALIWVMFACAILGGIVGYVIGRPGRHRGKDQQPRG
jgi:uncharacterized integral membrane protein